MMNSKKQYDTAIYAKHITEKKNLTSILKHGLLPKDGYVYLFIDGIITNPVPLFVAEVRDLIAYDQLFLCENEEAIELEVDITDFICNGEVYGEICHEPTERFHRLINAIIPPEKIISHKIFRVRDTLKPFRQINNKMQKKLRKFRGKRRKFQRFLYPIY